jgi:type VI secretion system protein ImpL
MSLRRIFGLILLFLFFEAAVAVVTMVLLPDTSVFLACAAMTGLAAAVWLVFIVTTRILMRPRAPQVPAAPRPVAVAKAAPSAGGDSFSQEIAELVREANNRLAASGQASIADLPLFLVVGPDGAGKTSILANGGMECQLLAGDAFRDSAILATNSCNLWFASGAVFADVSGRVVMQEPGRWESLLRVLGAHERVPFWKKILFGYTPARNFRGIVLVCDTNTFIHNDDPQKAPQLARKVHDRFETAGTVFGKDYPVYVIFSKTDTLPHFGEFFSHINEQEERRIVGATLPWVKPVTGNSAEIYAEQESKRLTESYGRLYASLADKRMELLARENGVGEKAGAYEFPRELKRIRNEVVHFLVDTFRPNPLRQGPRLRGFYFSAVRRIARVGSMKEGVTEISVVKGGFDATVFFGASRQGAQVRPSGGAAQPSQSRWVFLAELFHTVVLKDKAGWSVPQAAPRQQLYRNVAFGALTVILLFLCVAWANSWRHNVALLRGVEQHVREIPAGNGSLSSESLHGLESVREQLAELDAYDRDGVPIGFRWGLFQGYGQADALRALYFSRFRRSLLDPVLAAFTSRFSQLSGVNPSPVGDVYSDLKAYLMTTSGTCSPKQDLLNSELPGLRAAALPLPPELAILADRQIQFYIGQLVVKDPYGQQIAQDAPAVTSARNYLASMKGPETLLNGLLAQVNSQTEGDSLSKYTPNYIQVLSGPDRMAAAYTRDGWRSVLREVQDHKLTSAGEPCVVGTGAAVQGWIPNQNTEREVANLYSQKYTEQWKSFLDSHHVVPYAGFSDAAQKLRVLSDNNRSPLLALIYMISYNTDLPAEEKKVTVETIKTTIATTIQETIKKKTKIPVATPPPEANGPMEVKQIFQPVQNTVAPGARDKWLNETNREYLTSLATLSDALEGLSSHTDPAADQARYDRARQAKEVAWAAVKKLEQTFNNSSQQVDVALQRLLEEPIAGVRLPDPPVDVLKAKANAAAREFCSSFERLRKKYPFTPDSSDEASVEDLTRMFAPRTGEFWHFVQRDPFNGILLLQGKTWMQDPVAGQRLSPQFMNAVNDFSSLSDALFPDGGTQPHVDYRISLDETAKVPFDLDVDGHRIAFSGKPTKAIPLTWPPATSSALAALAFKSQGLNTRYQKEGVWGVFRVLNTADGHPTPGVFTFSRLELGGTNIPLLDHKGKPFSLEIRVDSSAAALFGRGYFSRFQCVSRAVQ